MTLVDRVVPPPTREERAKALQLALRDAARRGVTRVQDVGAAPGMDGFYAARLTRSS